MKSETALTISVVSTITTLVLALMGIIPFALFPFLCGGILVWQFWAGMPKTKKVLDKSASN